MSEDSSAPEEGGPHSPEESGQASAMLLIFDQILSVLETVNGYRLRALGMGYTPEAAEALSVQMHIHLLHSVR